MRNLSSLVDTSVQYHSRRVLGSLSAIHARPITWVHAPMGYGKTMAVRKYLEKRQASPLWVSIMTRDQDAFWRDFCNVLRRKLPDGAEGVQALEELGYPDDPAKLDVAREILAHFDFPAQSVLVFDDVHLLPESRTSGLVSLCLLLVRQGEFPPIVFISRHSPVQTLAEPLLKGTVTEIGPDGFAFTREEVGNYFELCGVSLEEDEADRLLAATGGWISALYLYLLHYARHGQLAAPTELSVLLETQVYDRLRDAKFLLLVLAPLESFTLAQAELFCDDAGTVLGDVLKRNAFLGYDPVSGVYTLHALFRGFLRDRYRLMPLDKRREVCLRNAEWLIRHGEIRKGVALLGEIGNAVESLELLNSVVDRLQVTEGNGVLLALFRTFDPALMERYPGVMFRYAMAALSARDIPTLRDLIGRLARYFASLPEDGAEANGWRGEMELLLSLTKYNDILAMSVHHERAGEFFRRGGVRQSRMFGRNPWTLGSPSVLYMFHREPGTLEQTLEQMRKCLPQYCRLTGMHGAGAEDVILAEARYNAGDFEAAAVSVHRGLSLSLAHGQTGIEVCARFLLARLSMMHGDYDQTMDQLRTMRERVEEKKTFSLLHTVDLCSGLLHATLHRLEDVPGWLAKGGDERFYAFAGGASYVLLGGVLLLAGEYAELVGRFSLLLEKGQFAANLMFSIHAHLFVAAGNAALGLWADSDDALFAALDLALPDRIYIPFATIAGFLPQLKSLKDDETYGYDIRRILQLSAAFEKARNSIISRFFPENETALTPRERELARLGMTGMTYKSIADALGLAQSTVKRYFAALFKKLGVNNREQLKQYLMDKEGLL
ncbi:LuxR C-terminal-related transcriptional regulator [uncultured Pseudodesulfovibrio sp.]|uniref:helix-turn-helix transcriptional regulator n=1 Tax=uncultured Pseudodesulfovibrio sp. TaxID=2035858 RepID=UPI0029C8A20C|nr:LuxR C-terminal-related transcriptional regulator [uncultured Pseudodesulfovibrio sp.]